jgi:hypothetical protein
MTPRDESAKLFESLDDVADKQLLEVQRRVERARDHIEDAARSIGSHMRGTGESPAIPPALAAKIAPAPVEALVELPSTPTETARVTPTPTVHDASDFGDIAANIAHDDWTKP